MYSNPQKLSAKDTQDLRQEAGVWLRELREQAGLSQRDLATAIGAEYYTFISQLETGRGRLPPDKYEIWAKAVGIPTRDLVKRLMRYYDPVTYAILFDDAAEIKEKNQSKKPRNADRDTEPMLRLLEVGRKARGV
jgi:transcriptional regulator with XRE-family HTH domain